jgi:phosphoesterase RecJ-like protein
VVVDANAWSQLGCVGDAIRGSPLPRFLIDHHRGGDADLAATRVADASAAATGVLVLEMCEVLGVPLAPRIATALYAAIAVDTGSFRFANTDARALRAAATLVAAGARPEEIYRLAFEEASWPRMRLLPRALATLRSEADGRIAWMVVTREMFRDAGAREEDCDRFVDQIRGIKGVEACAVLRETEAGSVKASFRSIDPVDVQEVAALFGGGGHKLAAGVTLREPLDAAAAKLIEALARALPPRRA